MESDAVTERTVFLTMVRTSGERAGARVLIESVRAFGGVLSRCPFWVFEAAPENASCKALEGADVRAMPLDLPDTLRHYYFADKVYACAQAEQMSAVSVRSLIWIDPACLVIQPPVLYDLGESLDAAVRPVHVANVGLAPDEPLDGFWRGVCDAVQVSDIPTTVETFVEGRRIRSYFNSHAFSTRPSTGLMRRWLECFEALVGDRTYQEAFCSDERHRVFLHQAVWSVLLVSELDPSRVRGLPPEYNYPYNLHQSVPAARRVAALNDVVSIAYESRSLDPAEVDDVEIHEPLSEWLRSRAAPS